MSDNLKIALIQTHLSWEDPLANRKHFEKKINSISEVVDLIILPEMFTTGFTMTPQNLAASESQTTVAWMKKQATTAKAAILGSMVYQEGDKFYNRLLFVDPDGSTKHYDKKHTFTLAGKTKFIRQVRRV